MSPHSDYTAGFYLRHGRSVLDLPLNISSLGMQMTIMHKLEFEPWTLDSMSTTKPTMILTHQLYNQTKQSNLLNDILLSTCGPL